MADTVGKAGLAAGLAPATVNAWMNDQRRRIAEDRFLYVSTHFVTTARRL
jgi:hypothetical protein